MRLALACTRSQLRQRHRQRHPRHQAADGDPERLDMAVVTLIVLAVRSLLSALAMVEETENEHRPAAARSGAYPRETKTGGSAGADFAAETVCHRGVGHGAVVSGGAVRFSRAGADDGGIFARIERHEIAVAGAKGKPWQFSGELRPGEVRQIRAGRK